MTMKKWMLHIAFWAIISSLQTASAQTVDADSLFFKARDLAFEQKKYDDAVAMLRNLLRDHPQYTDASVLLGRILFWTGSNMEAEQILRSIIDREPGRADAWAGLASGLLGLRRYDDALEVSTAAIALHPADTEIMRQHSFALAETGDFKSAVRQLDQLLQLTPDDGQALWLRREFLRRSRQHKVNVGLSRDNTLWLEENVHDKTSISVGYERFARRVTFGVNLSTLEWAGQDDMQIDLEAYPIINEAMYGFVTFSKSSDGLLYPTSKLGGSWFFTGFRSLELEMGVRYFWLTGDNASLYTGSVTYYDRRYYARIQVFTQNRGRSSDTSLQGTFRYYFDDTDPDYFLAVRLGQGVRGDEPRDAFDIIRTNTVNAGVELNMRLGGQFYLKPNVAVFRNTGSGATNGYLTLGIGASVRF